jgi:putative colanic acid biosynthesis UDP-glucose lipid carrier transferase
VISKCCYHTVRSNSTKKTFELRDDYGYHFFGYFSDKQENIEIKEIRKIKTFVLENEIDEIYCSLKKFRTHS